MVLDQLGVEDKRWLNNGCAFGYGSVAQVVGHPLELGTDQPGKKQKTLKDELKQCISVFDTHILSPVRNSFEVLPSSCSDSGALEYMGYIKTLASGTWRDCLMLYI